MTQQTLDKFRTSSDIPLKPYYTPDDAHASERSAHRSPSPRRAMTTWRISAEPPEIVEPTEAR